MAITLSPTAHARVKQFMIQDASTAALRFGVRKSGCTGFAYVVDLAKEVGAADHVFEQDGVRVLVDAESLPIVDGTTIDFVRKGLNAEFVFANPNVTAECGCGESFTVKADAKVQ
jgi:iron-sulfur cluster assembly protein